MSEGTWQGELDAAWYHRGVKVLGKVSWMQPGIIGSEGTWQGELDAAWYHR